ncbi:hypothetical protein UMC2_35651 [[Clostridium] sordellii]|uniref:hypothetical protein n=1 Tax=Paraclostridium sordellii TaxID=1505 RepID=UPI0005423063|nr:hypothetical protein [Paeniclostridium sordellii]CEK34354.1 hypothetical protein UMC2_35651 [[Clostridium] sordellii] [Paeniclostridium sordellii]
MNKFQKIAAQMAKDDLKKEDAKELGYNFRQNRNNYYGALKNKKINIKRALGTKNYNKELEW